MMLLSPALPAFFLREEPPMTMLPSSSHPALLGKCHGAFCPDCSYPSSMLSSSQTEMDRLWKASSCSLLTSTLSLSPNSSEATSSDSCAIMSMRSRKAESTLPNLVMRSRRASTNRRPFTVWGLVVEPSGSSILSRGLNASTSCSLRASLSWVRRRRRMRRISSGIDWSLNSTALSLSIVITSTAGWAPAFLAWSMLASSSRITLSSSPPFALRSIISFFMASGSPALRMPWRAAEARWMRALMVSCTALFSATSDSFSSESSCIRSLRRSRRRISMRS
mmetsp:Transcript_53962/g.110115  ORF Transcript_53962/g.110115 Transcript_53962/m.110115 type:complete len:279 (-) Transcript_53962:832-1668(-)